MSSDISAIEKALKAPFPAKDIEWRIGRKSRDGKKASVLAYIDARAVEDRLDEVVGIFFWEDVYVFHADGSVVCTLTIDLVDRKVSKSDGAEKTNIEATKGGISGAFKRAAAKWGIGRYLYNLEERWVEIDQYGNFTPPKLPAWALPSGDTSTAKVVAEPTQTENQAQEATQDPTAAFLERARATVAGFKVKFKDIPELKIRPEAESTEIKQAVLGWYTSLGKTEDEAIDRLAELAQAVKSGTT